LFDKKENGLSKKFVFTRIISVEERYSVEMSDAMASDNVAQRILLKSLNSDRLTEAVELLDSKVVKTGRIMQCK
jgi:hypothetical protein